MAPLQITPVHPVLGARVEGVDLTAAVDDATFRKIHDAFQEYSVLIFPGQRLTDAQQMAFTTRFGPLETTIKSIGQERRLHENMVDLSNVDPKAEERLMGWNDRRMLYQSGNQLWHTDSSFKPVPAMASLLSGREVPPTGGETEYVSMRHAHATLPAGLQRRLEGRVVVHSILYSRSTIAKGLFDPEHEQELPPVRRRSCGRTRSTGAKPSTSARTPGTSKVWTTRSRGGCSTICWPTRRGPSASTSTAGRSGIS